MAERKEPSFEKLSTLEVAKKFFNELYSKTEGKFVGLTLDEPDDKDSDKAPFIDSLILHLSRGEQYKHINKKDDFCEPFFSYSDIKNESVELRMALAKILLKDKAKIIYDNTISDEKSGDCILGDSIVSYAYYLGGRKIAEKFENYGSAYGEEGYGNFFPGPALATGFNGENIILSECTFKEFDEYVKYIKAQELNTEKSKNIKSKIPGELLAAKDRLKSGKLFPIPDGMDPFSWAELVFDMDVNVQKENKPFEYWVTEFTRDDFFINTNKKDYLSKNLKKLKDDNSKIIINKEDGLFSVHRNTFRRGNSLQADVFSDVDLESLANFIETIKKNEKKQ